jgi:polar amino acid transport system substrate-binding protein
MTLNDEVTGVSTEVVSNVLSRAGITYTIESYPWARSYKLAQKGPASLIYSIGRRAKRENLFKWIGVVVPSVQSVYALRSRTDIDIKELDDMKNYEIGTTLNDSRETFLLNNSFTEGDLRRASGDDPYLLNYKKLKMGHIDLWPMPDAVAFYLVKQAGDDPSTIIRKVFEFEEISRDGYYIAASLEVPEETVDTIRESLEEFKRTPEYENILEKWGLGL